MGGGRWDSASYSTVSAGYIGRSTEQVFTSRQVDQLLNPLGVAFRESRDSEDNPESTPAIIGIDVTGSMGEIADALAREGLDRLCTEIYKRKPITDPHILCMGVGDVEMSDRGPLQVTQFEADLRILEQLTKIWLEKGGGGNSYESYALPWYFAAQHTVTDAYEKRGKKGYLFTVGDEGPTPYLRAKDIARVMGDIAQPRDYTGKELFEMASEKYRVFHIMVEQGSHYRNFGRRVAKEWVEMIGKDNVLLMSDYRKMPEIIVSVMLEDAGQALDAVAASWGDKTVETMVRKARKFDFA